MSNDFRIRWIDRLLDRCVCSVACRAEEREVNKVKVKPSEVLAILAGFALAVIAVFKFL